MKTFRVYWNFGKSESFYGYCKARNVAEALDAFRSVLSKGFIIETVKEVAESAITAKEICVNFVNPRYYEDVLAG